MKQAIRILLIGGQSNAVGLTPKDSLDEAYRNGRYPNVLLYQEGNFTAESKGKIHPEVSLGMGCKPHHMGIEYGIAQELNDLGGTFGLIRFAYGGTDLGFHWQTAFDKIPQTVEDKGYCYYEFVNTVKRGLAAFREAGYQATVEGMVWMQGESDTNKTLEQALQYEDNLRLLFAAIRQQLQLPQLKILVGGISTQAPLAPYSQQVRQAQERYCQTDPLARYLDNTDLPLGEDGWHYRGKEDLILGKRFGQHAKDFML